MPNQSPETWINLVEPLRRFMRSRMRDEHAAADLAQEAMLKAHAAWETAPEGERLAPWLFAVARNTLIDFYRSSRSRGHVPMEEVAEPVAVSDESDATAVSDLSACLRRM